MKALYAADLFCGAGGASTGAARAAERLGRKLKLAAVNHWARAVETHARNHPDAAHFCEDLTSMDPKRAVPGGRLDLLIAAPECTHHSVARGGMPINDQSRASAWCVLRWCTALKVDRVLIENVPEFQTWGPIGSSGRPLPSKRGETFSAFINSIRSLGYRVEWRVLNAADFGGATTRRRLFIQAVKGKRPIRWPMATHEPHPSPSLVDPLPRWRAAREIIDWGFPGQSIFTRERPLSPNTLKRIAAGLQKFGGRNAEPFLVMLRRHADGRSIDLPIPTLTAGGNHVGLCQPFVVGVSNPNGNGSYVYNPDRPLPTVTSANDLRLVEPFIARVSNGGGEERRTKSVDEPLGTFTCANTFGLVEPFLMHTTHHGGERVHPVSDPMPTVTGANRGEQALIEPFIVPQLSGGSTRSVEQPVPTITTTSRGVGLCEPFLVPFYANGQADAVSDPLRTVTTKDRHALVEPHRAALDIRFRMLQPHELAAAMGFPRDYQITGNRSEQVKQIGNAIVVEQADALVHEMLIDN